MTTSEIVSMLIKGSPFIVRKDIKNDDKYYFTDTSIRLNSEYIADYRIERDAGSYFIAVSGNSVFRGRFEIYLRYNEEPLIIRDASPSGHDAGEPTPLIPEARILEDEQSER